MKRTAQFTTVLTLSVLLSGCFGFNFVFERLDQLLVWQADRMLDLSGEQEDAMAPAAVAIREWIRAEGIPLTVDKLEAIDQQWRAGQHYEAAVQFREESKVIGRQLMTASWQALSDFLLSLNEANADAYESYVESHYDEWYEESTSQKNKVHDRIEKLEDWFGDLTDQQVALVHQHTQWQAGEFELRVANSRQWRVAFLTHIQQNNRTALASAFADPTRLQTPEYQRWVDQQSSEYDTMMQQLLPTLSEDQKTHASERLEDWIGLLKGVAPPVR